MKILTAYPPLDLYDRIQERWPEVADMPYVVFAYDGNIYNPSGKEMPLYMIEHEKVHLRQQLQWGGAEVWWYKYLTFDTFRLEQELEAYRQEYECFCAIYKDRNERNAFLQFQATMLSSPMYGGIISKLSAVELIKNGRLN